MELSNCNQNKSYNSSNTLPSNLPRRWLRSGNSRSRIRSNNNSSHPVQTTIILRICSHRMPISLLQVSVTSSLDKISLTSLSKKRLSRNRNCINNINTSSNRSSRNRYNCISSSNNNNCNSNSSNPNSLLYCSSRNCNYKSNSRNNYNSQWFSSNLKTLRKIQRWVFSKSKANKKLQGRKDQFLCQEIIIIPHKNSR